MLFRNRNFRDSIVTRLIVVIFGLYFIVAVAVTIIQLTSEYYHEKDLIAHEITLLPETFGNSISAAMWTYSDDLIHTILIGINKLPIVTGTKVVQHNGTLIDAVGTVKVSNKDNPIKEGHQYTIATSDSRFLQLFEHTFPVIYRDEHGETHNLGSWMVYSSQMIIFNRVKYAFFIILINSIIKTAVLWFIFYFVIKRILGKPLEKFKQDIENINLDNLENASVSIHVKHHNELKMLEQAFNEMIGNMLVSRQAIDAINRNLEETVKERTANLTQANQALRREIEERKRVESEIQASLREKEILLREIHHRVKNNMQMIQSLISLQADRIDDPEYRRPLMESNRRIQVMALVHESLYRSEKLSAIDLKQYFNDLVGRIMSAYGDPEKTIDVIISVEPLDLHMDKIISCGLIVNELITNALKYAFNDKQQGEISIILKRQSPEQAELVIRDNGTGMPEDFDPAQAASLGLRLVWILARDQLDGEIHVDRAKGVYYSIRFPIEA